MIGGYCPRLEPAAKERIMALFLTRLIVLTLFLTGPASAKKPECSLALAFALDVSVSVDHAEYKMQRDGLASALWDPVVRSVILSQPGAVALMAYEWSGHSQQIIIAPWAFIASEQDLSAFIAHLSGHKRVDPMYPTALGAALGFGAIMLDDVSWCDRLVLDVSGDGVHNDHYPPKSAYRHFPFEGVTVNGLVVEGDEPEVLTYYVRHVISGPGAFVEIATGYPDFPRAMRKKLLRELRGQLTANR